MGETERSPHISLEIDQEIFVDIVQDGDTIEDATVSTEVISFERVGDAYVLEGAIVFAGFMDRSNVDGTQEDSSDGFVDALCITDDTMDVEQFHHRLPFVLRVPVKSQSRGIVNVASRISDWQLEVVSAGWIRIQGDLTIVGLNGSQGYHFQCGAQEDGDLFFKETVETISVEAPPAYDARNSEASAYDQPADEYDDFVAANSGTDEPKVEYASEPVESNNRSYAEETSDKANSEAELGKDLQRLSRAFVQSEPSQSWEQPEQPQKPVASFEFQDQVSDLSTPAVGTGQTEFKPSKSFSDAGFRAAFERTVEADNDEAVPAADEAVEETVEVSETRGAEAADDETRTVSVRDNMWSFVDFDGPERTCTLRFVIVEHEASIDDLAEKYGCSKLELMRTNRISPETVVRPGQSLALPVESSKR